MAFRNGFHNNNAHVEVFHPFSLLAGMSINTSLHYWLWWKSVGYILLPFQRF